MSYTFYSLKLLQILSCFILLHLLCLKSCMLTSLYQQIQIRIKALFNSITQDVYLLHQILRPLYHPHNKEMNLQNMIYMIIYGGVFFFQYIINPSYTKKESIFFKVHMSGSKGLKGKHKK